jgi:DNA modification methylase
MKNQTLQKIQQVNIEQLVISEITQKLYDYTNRKSDIDSISESMKEIGQREPIIVIRDEENYLIIDGVLRYKALKSLKINKVAVIEVEFSPSETFSLTDFIIHHHIRKEKTANEKINEVRSLLRIGENTKNPSRDKENRVKLTTQLMGGKGWGRNNVFSLENIIVWEDSSDYNLGLSQGLAENQIKVNRALEAISLIEENKFDVESEKESKIISDFLKGKFDRNQAETLITAYKRKKGDSPTDIPSVIGNDNFQLLVGDAETVELPDDLRIDTIFTSPPYYKLRKYGDDENELGWEKTPDLFVKRLADILMRGFDKLNETGSMFVNMGESYDNKECQAVIPRLTLELIQRGAIYNDTIIWDKPAAKPVSSKAKRLKNNYEVILHFVKSKNFYFERININDPKKLRTTRGCKDHFEPKVTYHIPNKYSAPSNVLSPEIVGNIFRVSSSKNRFEAKDGEESHPGTFPWTLPLLPLLMSCPKDEKTVVFDPFAGTSSTGVTALTMGFKFVGVELYEKNVETSKRALRNHQQEFSTQNIEEVLDGMGYSVESNGDNLYNAA